MTPDHAPVILVACEKPGGSVYCKPPPSVTLDGGVLSFGEKLLAIVDCAHDSVDLRKARIENFLDATGILWGFDGTPGRPVCMRGPDGGGEVFWAQEFVLLAPLPRHIASGFSAVNQHEIGNAIIHGSVQ